MKTILYTLLGLIVLVGWIIVITFIGNFIMNKIFGYSLEMDNIINFLTGCLFCIFVFIGYVIGNIIRDNVK